MNKDNLVRAAARDAGQPVQQTWANVKAQMEAEIVTQARRWRDAENVYKHTFTNAALDASEREERALFRMIDAYDDECARNETTK